MNIVVAGIHTGIGKTFCSAILCAALDMDYWKPVQAGSLENTDSIFIKINTPDVSVHPEKYKLKTAASPHYAASVEGINIRANDFIIPASEKGIVIETAGGIMSPLSNNFLNLDLMVNLGCPVVLVSENYLGSINHTLMSMEVLRARKVNVLGIIFNGEKNEASEDFILQYAHTQALLDVPKFNEVSATAIREFISANEDCFKKIKTKTTVQDDE